MPIPVTNTPILIRRHVRSRLYDAAHERYVSVDTLRIWQAQAVAFIVLDAETSDDVPHVLLA